MSETKDYALKTMKYKHHSRYEEQANQAAYKADLAILRMMES